MNKRFLYLLSFFTVLFSNFVFAQDSSRTGIVGIIGRLSNFLFIDLANIGVGTGAPETAFLGLKLVVWILLFTIFNFGLKKINFDKKTSGIIALVSSLGAVILIPGIWLFSVFLSWGTVFVLILGLAAPVLGYYFSFQYFNGEQRSDYLGSGVLYLLAGWSLGSVMKTFESLKAPAVISALGAENPAFASIDLDIIVSASSTSIHELFVSLAEVSMWVTMVLGIWFLFHALIYSKSESEHEQEDDARRRSRHQRAQQRVDRGKGQLMRLYSGRNDISRNLSRMQSVQGHIQQFTPAVIGHLNRSQERYVDRFNNYVDSAIRLLRLDGQRFTTRLDADLRRAGITSRPVSVFINDIRRKHNEIIGLLNRLKYPDYNFSIHDRDNRTIWVNNVVDLNNEITTNIQALTAEIQDFRVEE